MPTPAALLTGLFQHQAGIGHMTKEPGNRIDEASAAEANGQKIHPIEGKGLLPVLRTKMIEQQNSECRTTHPDVIG